MNVDDMTVGMIELLNIPGKGTQSEILESVEKLKVNPDSSLPGDVLGDLSTKFVMNYEGINKDKSALNFRTEDNILIHIVYERGKKASVEKYSLVL